MLFFLRNIRRKMLSRNSRVFSYLLYALGEIFLVVVGILIAVQIDNWNEERIKDKEGLEYRARLVSNLTTDNISIAKRIEFFKIVYDYGEYADSILSGNGSVDDEVKWKFVFASYQVSQIWPFRATTTTYNELQNNGVIQYVAKDSILQKIATYYIDSNEQMEQLNDGTTAYRDYIRGIVPMNLQEFMWENCFENWDLENQKFVPCEMPGDLLPVISEVYQMLWDDQQLFRKMLTRRMSTLYIRNSLMKAIQDKNEVLITSLSKSKQ